MKRTAAAAIALFALVLVALIALQASAAGIEHGKMQKKGGSIEIQSWLHGKPDAVWQSGTVKACAKIKLNGVVIDRSAKPNWTNDAEYENADNPSAQCATEEPVGGFVLLPPTKNDPPRPTDGLQTVYAVHTIPAEMGNIFITFSGTYNLTTGPIPTSASPTGEVLPGECTATWVITGGTGAYKGLQGEGLTTTCHAYPASDGTLYILHTSTGTVKWAR